MYREPQHTSIHGSNFVPVVLFLLPKRTQTWALRCPQSGAERSGDLAGQAMLPKGEVMETRSMAVDLLIIVLCVPLHISGHGHRDQRPRAKSTAIFIFRLRHGRCAAACITS
jgi:hypothetical protein